MKLWIIPLNINMKIIIIHVFIFIVVVAYMLINNPSFIFVCWEQIF